MQINVFSAETVEELVAQMSEDRLFSFVSVHCNADLDVSALIQSRRSGAVIGATSCLGAMTQHGQTSGLAAFAITDPDGSYGAAMFPIGDDPSETARAATLAALRDADRAGERPDLVWMAGTPGHEEDLIRGIEAVLGPDVPIIGGSAADNTVSGDWFVFDRAATAPEGVVVSVLFPSRPLSFAYQSGYAPTEKSGIATDVSGRTIKEINGRPAIEVYSEWTDGDITASTDGPRPILSESTLWPLGREMATYGDVPYYLLAHPAATGSTGALEMFANVDQGEELTLMTGSIRSLTERAGRTAALARSAGRLEGAPVSGALMIYCGGCMLAVKDALDDVTRGVKDALDGAPFVGAFTFGEQGQILKTGNRHGNLMISCIVFS